MVNSQYHHQFIMPLHAELHRHLGGSVVPRILWRYFQRHNPQFTQGFAEYEGFEDFYTKPRNTLDEYLELHTMVESVQTVETLPLFLANSGNNSGCNNGIWIP